MKRFILSICFAAFTTAIAFAQAQPLPGPTPRDTTKQASPVTGTSDTSLGTDTSTNTDTTTNQATALPEDNTEKKATILPGKDSSTPTGEEPRPARARRRAKTINESEWVRKPATRTEVKEAEEL